jgi:hypothetical protein
VSRKHEYLTALAAAQFHWLHIVTFAEAGPPFVAALVAPPFLRASRIGMAVAEMVKRESTSGVQEEMCIVMMDCVVDRDWVEESEI